MHPADLADLTIAVIGAGYGGAAAAKALTRLGATVHIYEQATVVREVGAGIGLRPPTLDLFRQWGIFDAMAAVSSPSDYFEILTAAGQPITREEWPGIHDYPQETKTRFIHRGDFIEAFFGVLPPEAVHLGHRLETIADLGDRATITFANGARVTADLVIGADGIRSAVRRQLFSDKPPVFAGEHAFRAVISADAVHGLPVDANLRMYIGDNGTKIYVLPLLHRNQVSYDITALSSDDSWAPAVTTDDLIEMVRGFDQRLVNITRDLDPTAVSGRAVYDIDPLDRWHSNCVALLGDAAHAMLHHQGQGANQAIQDAGGLADALATADDVPSALAMYQAARKQVTDNLQLVSRQSWDAAAVDTAFPGQKPAAASPAAGRG